MVATGDEGLVWGIDPDDGLALWTANLGTAVFTNPLLVDGKAVVGDGSGTVSAFDLGTGQRQWRVTVAGAVRGGAAFDGEQDLRRRRGRRGRRPRPAGPGRLAPDDQRAHRRRRPTAGVRRPRGGRRRAGRLAGPRGRVRRARPGGPRPRDRRGGLVGHRRRRNQVGVGQRALLPGRAGRPAGVRRGLLQPPGGPGRCRRPYPVGRRGRARSATPTGRPRPWSPARSSCPASTAACTPWI